MALSMIDKIFFNQLYDLGIKPELPTAYCDPLLEILKSKDFHKNLDNSVAIIQNQKNVAYNLHRTLLFKNISDPKEVKQSLLDYKQVYDKRYNEKLSGTWSPENIKDLNKEEFIRLIQDKMKESLVNQNDISTVQFLLETLWTIYPEEQERSKSITFTTMLIDEYFITGLYLPKTTEDAAKSLASKICKDPERFKNNSLQNIPLNGSERMFSAWIKQTKENNPDLFDLSQQDLLNELKRQQEAVFCKHLSTTFNNFHFALEASAKNLAQKIKSHQYRLNKIPKLP